MNQISWTSWNLIEDEFVQKHSNKTNDKDDKEEAVLEILSMPVKNTIQTPFGEVEIDNPLRPANLWQCWTANTNFRITYEIVDLLMNIDGVAVIKILDRYSFCIGVGQLFDSAVVKNNIVRLLCPNNKPSELVLSTFSNVKQHIDTDKEWCVYIKDDGSHLLYNGDSESDYLDFVRAFEVIKSKEGGFIFTKEKK